MLLSPKLRGVNLGGWMVLTPWLTPSLFYQFEDKPSEQTALDMHSFCRVLGPAEGNRQLREHWSKWVTDDDLAQLASQGINTLRVPVGDWMWEPYEPYTGCTNGSVTELRRMLRRCEKHGLRVLIDLHGGHASARSLLPSPRTTLSLSHSRAHTLFIFLLSVRCAAADIYTRRRAHLSERLRQFRPRDEHLVGGRRHAFRPLAVPVCRWQGSFDPLTFSYSSISWDNLRSTVSLLQRIALSLRSYPMVLGLEALNELWQFTPLDVLKAFYWDAYWAVRAAAPTWLFVVHDSLRLDEWQGFMKGCRAVALDTHVYQAWFDIRSQDSFLENACSWRQRVNAVQRATLPLLVGEWALATDNCAMVSEKRATQCTQRTRAHDTSRLSPTHHHLSLSLSLLLCSGSTASTTTPPGFPKVSCAQADCPQPYVSDIPGPPKGPSPGPWGTGNSAPSFGKCPTSKPWENEEDIMPRLAQHHLSAFDEAAGWFYFNFKHELHPYWSWQTAWRRGWLPLNLSHVKPMYLNVCRTENEGQSECAASRRREQRPPVV